MSFQIQNSEVLARLKPFGISFEKSLGDLIKGIRSHSKISPDSLSTFLDSAIQECKNELSTTDMETKAMAILKLTYLEMYGFDMSWCNFQILEVMSSAKFQQKRIGYLAAIQSFKNEQDLLILATNQFKKDLNSHNHGEIGLALSGIATIVTPNLSKDINDDVLMKFTHSKPYIRKKAVLAMYKIFLQYPDSLRINFHRILDMLDDPDVSVVSAAINVICEISKKSPSVFVNYLPKFFTILEETKNNWLIIRILKLFQSLSKVEPRMKKKILPTIIDLMLSTQASSLIYECINCIVGGSMLSPDSSRDKDTAKLCIEQIMKFFETRDSNLKFVGLLALINIIKIFPSLIHKVKGVSQVIMECLTDNDLIIKTKALEVCHYLVNENNIVEVVQVLLLQLIPPSEQQQSQFQKQQSPISGSPQPQSSSARSTIPETLKLNITMKILSIVSQDNYENVPNFKWYVAVLKDMINLTLLPLPSVTAPKISNETADTISNAIGQEFKTLAARIPSIRPIILNKVIFSSVQDVNIIDNCPNILKDFYWIMGEYIDDLRGDNKASNDDDEDDDEDDDDEHGGSSVADLGKKIQIFNAIVNEYIDAKNGRFSDLRFPVSSKLIDIEQAEVLTFLIQALVKLYSGIFTDYTKHYSHNSLMNHDKFIQLAFYLHKLINYLGNWEYHPHYEVQERALSWLEFLKICLESMVGEDFKEIERLETEEVEYFKEKQPIEEAKESESESEEDEVEEDGDDDDDSDEYSEVEDSDEDEDEDEEEQNKIETRPVEISPPPFNPFQEDQKLPMLLTHILPSFFKSYQLNPISADSQRNIPLPEDLDLSQQINPPLFDALSDLEDSDDDASVFEENEDGSEDSEALIKLSSSEEDLKKKERLEKQKYDPYYITSGGSGRAKNAKNKTLLDNTVAPPSGTSSSDILSINSAADLAAHAPKKTKKSKKLKKEKVVILSEEKIGGNDHGSPNPNSVYQLQSGAEPTKKKSKKKNSLRIDSSNLDNFDLNTPSHDGNGLSGDGAESGNYEYNIDLEELRSKLETTSVSTKKKTKSKKSADSEKPKKKKKSTDAATVAAEDSSVVPDKAVLADPVDTVESPVTREPKSGTPDSEVIAVKKTTKKKKKKAVIAE